MPIGILSENDFSKEVENFAGYSPKKIGELVVDVDDVPDSLLENEMEQNHDPITKDYDDSTRSDNQYNSVADIVSLTPRINASALVIDPTPLGRPVNKPNAPESLRKVIAEEKLNGASNKELAKVFNTGEQIPSVYANGATSAASYGKKDKSLQDFIDIARGRVLKKASNRMLGALNAITEDKLQKLDARDAATVAKDMSAVIKNLAPEKEDKNSGGNLGVQVVVYAPRQSSEDDYDVIEVKKEA